MDYRGQKLDHRTCRSSSRGHQFRTKSQSVLSAKGPTIDRQISQENDEVEPQHVYRIKYLYPNSMGISRYISSRSISILEPHN
jgi:hypothetical protein